MKFTILWFLTVGLLFSNDNLNLEDDFLNSLEEVSEIATKTKLNIDDSPSFITVLHQNKLQKLGVDTVFEALAQVPGVQLKREATGVPVVIFRGVSQKGEVKLMIDGVTINNAYRGSIYHYLDFPIELVDRIEVIRGAGSVLYGSGAISGVINIITKSSNQEEKQTVFLSGGTYQTKKTGAIVATDLGFAKLALDTYYQENNKIIDKTDRHLKDYSVGLHLSDEHFALIARLKKSDIGNAYGVIGVPDLNENKYYNENENIFTQLSYNTPIAQKSNIEVLAGFNRYGQVVEVGHPNSSIDKIDTTYREHSYYGEVNFKSSAIENNEVLIGTKFETVKAIKSEWKIATASIPPVANPDSARDITSLYFNDTYSLSPVLDISAGLRYDNYSDSGDAYSPTVGAVYRVNSDIRIKALYAHAFRAPSWIELTSNSSLKAENSDTFEAGVVYKHSRENTLRLNVYRTNLNDMITRGSITRKYIQISKTKFLGTEFEYIFIPNNQLEFNLFASYVKAEDANGNDLEDIANYLATTSLIYELDNGLSFGSLLKYISSSKRASTDTRGDFDNSIVFNETISYSFKDFTASLVVKDLFNRGTYYALPSSTANNDFDDGGRSFLLKATVEF